MRAKAVLLLCAGLLLLSPALAQGQVRFLAEGQVVELRQYGEHRLVVDLRGQTRPLTVLGANVADPATGWTAEAKVTQNTLTYPRTVPYSTAEAATGSLSPGQEAEVRIQYDPVPSPYVPVLLRGRASNGNMFNRGTLVVSSRWDAPVTTDPGVPYHMVERADEG